MVSKHCDSLSLALSPCHQITSHAPIPFLTACHRPRMLCWLLDGTLLSQELKGLKEFLAAAATPLSTQADEQPKSVVVHSASSEP